MGSVIKGELRCPNCGYRHTVRVDFAGAARREALSAVGATGAGLLGLTQCDGANVTGPSPSPPMDPPPPSPEPAPVPPPSVGIPADIRCVSAFALGLRNEHQIVAFCHSAHGFGYNMVRIFSETARWRGGGFFGTLQGPFPGNLEQPDTQWLESVHRAVETSIRAGMAVELVVSATVKETESGGWHADYGELLGELLEKWGLAESVMVSAVNEWRFGRSQLKRGDVNEMIRRLKRFSFPATADEPGPPWEWTLSPLVDVRGFHSRRNPEPDRKSLQRAISKHGRVFFDETVAYIADEDPAFAEFAHRGTVAQGTQEQRRDQVTQHLRDIVAVGGWPCYHSFEGMAGISLTWAPVL